MPSFPELTKLNCDLGLHGPILAALHSLMETYSLPREALPLIYFIMKESGFDIRIASSKIFEAQTELRTLLLQEAAMQAYPYYNYFCLQPPVQATLLSTEISNHRNSNTSNPTTNGDRESPLYGIQ